jgi:hypothetical protein
LLIWDSDFFLKPQGTLKKKGLENEVEYPPRLEARAWFDRRQKTALDTHR